MKKQTEEAAVQREAAKKAEDELEAIKQKLSNLEIDLRFERRELKTAEEKIKTLQVLGMQTRIGKSRIMTFNKNFLIFRFRSPSIIEN